MNVPAGSKLEITYIGMNPQTVKASSNMKIALTSDNKTLDEVVVVAYGTTTKASFTGSAAVMKDKDMSAAKSSLVKSLEGKMAGVNLGASTGDPGSDQSILIRGIGSINGSTQPLFVIDGVPVSNSDMENAGGHTRSQSILSSINPNDIESMTVHLHSMVLVQPMVSLSLLPREVRKVRHMSTMICRWVGVILPKRVHSRP